MARREKGILMFEEGAGIKSYDVFRAPAMPMTEWEGRGEGRGSCRQEPVDLQSDDTRFALSLGCTEGPRNRPLPLPLSWYSP
jgi:hypothetical protein